MTKLILPDSFSIAPSRAELACMLGELAVDSITGIMSDCVELMNEVGDPRLYFYVTHMADTSRYQMPKCFGNNGGAGLTAAHAKAAAIGESLERYASAMVDHRALVLATARELGSAAVGPEEWVLYSHRQYQQLGFPYQPFTADTPLYWVAGRSLVSGQERYVPATFVYVPYYPTPEEVPIAPSVSTGLSAALSPEEAILGGIYEYVERDAITIMWMNRLSMPVIDPMGDSRYLGALLKERFLVDQAAYHLVDITTDLGIPVVFGIKEFRSGKGTAVACGAACRLDPEAAATKAAIEAAQGAKWVLHLHMEDYVWGYRDDFSDIVQFKDHVRLYGEPEMVPRLRFVHSSPVRKPVADMPNLATGDPASDLEVVLEKLERHGLDAITVDVTTPDVAELGFYVMKTLVPGLQPLQGDHRFPHLGGNRLYQVPHILGYYKDDRTEQDLNPDPHPFP